LLLLTNANLGIRALGVGLDVGGHAAVASAPFGGGIRKHRTVFCLAHGQDSLARLALGVNGTAGTTQERTALFGHERTLNAIFDSCALHIVTSHVKIV
jgi:hypothetical protein